VTDSDYHKSEIFSEEQCQAVEFLIEAYEWEKQICSKWISGFAIGVVTRSHPSVDNYWEHSVVVRADGSDEIPFFDQTIKVSAGQAYIFRFGRHSRRWSRFVRDEHANWPGALKVGQEIEWLRSNGTRSDLLANSNFPEDSFVRPKAF